MAAPFIDSDRLSAELDPVLVLDAPITPALIGADGNERRGDNAMPSAARCALAMRAWRPPPRRPRTPSRRTSPRKIAAQRRSVTRRGQTHRGLRRRGRRAALSRSKRPPGVRG